MITQLDRRPAATDLYDPSEHESLMGPRWNDGEAAAFVTRILRETDDAYHGDCRWPLHPEDREADELESLRGIYCGTAGTIWALTRLAERYDYRLRHHYATELAWCEERYRAHPFDTDGVSPSYFLGAAGILMARYAVTGDASLLDGLEREIAANVGNPAREAQWGSSGSALAALLVREHCDTTRFDALIAQIQYELWATWEGENESGGLLWQQDLYERKRSFVGAAHGATGNLAPFIRAPRLLASERLRVLPQRIERMLSRYAIHQDGGVNWYTLGHPTGGNRLQWCHGAPGIITSLAALPPAFPGIERLLCAAGETIWRAGALRKGPTLCHGTAGNGFALLRLAQRTGDDRWRERAREFAVHAMLQVERWRQRYVMPAFSLWTGDLGVALFVDAVRRDDPRILTVDCL